MVSSFRALFSVSETNFILGACCSSIARSAAGPDNRRHELIGMVARRRIMSNQDRQDLVGALNLVWVLGMHNILGPIASLIAVSNFRDQFFLF